ncbi:YidC/Oxa1 family membrane protein insertase [Patescibacteria group bacterium]|nr:YidC/Oxa1 family membrane protein insertase [Patescibacteria group bacterium]
MIALWHTIFYNPLYNALVWLVDVLPNHSLFIAVVILTVIVRLIISPLSYKALKTQLQTKALQPRLKQIKKEFTDKQEQARQTFALYKEHGVNPFSSFLLILVQFPVIIALYWVFREGGVEINPDILYPLVHIPDTINHVTFGVDLAQKSYLLAFLTGLTQYIHLSRSASFKQASPTGDESDQEKMMTMVGKSMRYTMPVMITIFAYIIGGAVALYWVTSNIFMIVQEHFIMKRLKKKEIV